MITTIQQWLKVLLEGDNVREVVGDPGTSANSTSQVFGPSGFDAEGFPQDLAVVIDIGGGRVAVGYLDPKLSPIAEAGEVVIFSRSAPGVIAGKIHLKASGSIFLNGVEITPTGEIKAPLEVSAMNATAPVKLSTHLHPTAMGPSGAPTPGT